MTWKKLLWVLLSVLMAGAVFAGDAEDGLVGPPFLQFSFSNPGARSMGFGGAFVALADDATAAFANPAGLVQLTEPEVTLELRRWSYSTPYVEGGRLEGEPSGMGIDNIAGVRTATSSDDISGVSFLSFVYPKDKWSIAFYRHELANFESLTQTQGLFFGDPPNRVLDLRVSTDLEIVGYGASGAYQVSESLSLGVSLVYFDGNLNLTGQSFRIDEDTVEGFFAPNSYLPERMVGQGSLVVDDSDLGVSAGFLWSLTPQWRVGGFFREGPDFDVALKVVAGPGNFDGLPPGTFATGSADVSFPDVFGLGLSFRSNDGRLTLGFEWDRVQYSQILDSLASEDLDVSNDRLNDADEFHLGGEYAFLGTTPVAAIRLGVWHDPNHRPHNVDDDDPLAALFPQGDDQIHYALGFGLSFDRFQLDFAADFSELVDTISVSGIYRF